MFAISIATAGLIPRGLGPRAYGEFSFLSDFFSKVVGFLNTGTSLGFFAKISQRQHEHALIRFYWGFFGFACVGMVLLVAGASVLGVENYLWPSQQLKYVWLAVVWGGLIWMSENISKLVDAYALTAKGEIIRVSQKILGTGLLLLLFWLDRFSLTMFFAYQYVITLFLCLAWARILRQHGVPVWPRRKLNRPEIRSYSKEFYTYSAPLFVYSLVSLVTGIFDRWILQTFSGSVEQGYFGLSVSIGAVCFLFASAMTPLILREFAVAATTDTARMRKLFARHIPLLFAITTIIAVFVSVQADKVSTLLGGAKFQEASLAVGIMALYPIFQTYGQLNGSFFYATGKTQVYRNIGVFTMVLGSIVTLFVLAPKEYSGLAAGATGLAFKTVLAAIVLINLQLWYACKHLQLKFTSFLGHQILALVAFGLISTGAARVADALLTSTLLSFLFSGSLYVAVSLVSVCVFPQLLFLSRQELRQLYESLKPRIPGFRVS